ncbi:hypothetical protein PsYK624_002130 [Phanerochaete sordida]|uniref:F-box domain-containing protein n=1 Tax=Phanerochaete sordida TaxID=48140 RepID=A0A9P3FX51_9APHY|nr:hypothetical protein PsYK624_002130 [Phanerochaete sordida]
MTDRCTFADLPLEIVDLIFTHVRNESPQAVAIMQCSLVCHAWEALSLRHRFHKLRLGIHLPSDSFWSGGRTRYVDKFTKTDVFTRVHGLVRELLLQWGEAASDRSVGPDFPAVAALFPGLHSLALLGVFDNRQIVPPPAAPQATPLLLDTLILREDFRRYSKARHAMQTLCAVLAHFSSVRELHLLGLGTLSAGPSVRVDDYTLPSVDVLVLRGFSLAPPVAALLQKLSGSKGLRTLDLFAFSGKPLNAVLRIAGALQPQPAHICCSAALVEKCKPVSLLFGFLHLKRDLPPAEPSPDFSSLHNMTRLTLAVEIVGSSTPAAAAAWVIVSHEAWLRTRDALTSLPANCTLACVDLWLTLFGRDEPDSGRDALQMTLAEGHARGDTGMVEDVLLALVERRQLEHVRVSLWRAPPREYGVDAGYHLYAEDFPATLFPRLDALGVLRRYEPDYDHS